MFEKRNEKKNNVYFGILKRDDKKGYKIEVIEYIGKKNQITSYKCMPDVLHTTKTFLSYSNFEALQVAKFMIQNDLINK